MDKPGFLRNKFKICWLICLLSLGFFKHTKALQVTIIESQSFLSSDIMDTKWQAVAIGMGHTANILPQTTLDNNAFFSSTDLLIISSGTVPLPANRVAIIQQFLQTGKPVYLQGEYLCSSTANQAFAFLVNNLGGAFSWGTTTSGIFTVNVLGSFSNTNNVTSNLNGFNFGCEGSGCGIQYFLERNSKFYGYFFCPSNPNYGSLIQITDQDWINFSTNNLLMENIITHLTNGALCNPSTFTPTQLGADTTLCVGEILTLNATSANASYLWQNGSSNPTFTVTTPGTYWVQVSNSCGIFSDTIHINYAPAPNLNLGNDTLVCAGQSITLNAGNPGATYVWQDGSTNSTFSPTAGGYFWVKVNIGGCVVTDTVIVNFVPSPYIDLGKDTTLCIGQTLVLNASNSMATKYTWQDGSNNATYSVTQAGVYSVVVATSCGNITDQINISFVPGPTIDLGEDLILCAGNSVTLDATNANAISYLWNDQTNSPTKIVTTSGTYWAEISSAFCKVRDSIKVNVIDNISVSLGQDTTLCKGQSLTLNASTNNALYYWQDNSIGPQYTVTQAGIYWVKVSIDQCSDSDTIQVSYYDQPCTCVVNMPNAFTPNNDYLNDEFKYISNGGDLEIKDFIIYSRWGDIVFNARNSFDGWDGKIKGSEASIGTYFYYLKYKCSYSGKEFVLKGDVTLIR